MNTRKPDLSEIKETVVNTAGVLLEKTRLLKDAAGEKARILTQKAKIRAESARNSSRLDRLYGDLGSLYYCIMKDCPDEQMRQLCEEITVLLDRNEELDRQLEELRQIEDPAEETYLDDGETAPEEAASEESGEASGESEETL
ncbi:MAG: hypothetical protein K6C09_01235 [Oscillospiraceae bacterium]|nr:hypothetical protein [Oscillospiraceae bacterium]